MIKNCVDCGKKTEHNRCRKCYDYYRSHRALWQNKDWLWQQYQSGKSFDTIAKENNCGHTTIKYWFEKFKLKSRPAPSTGLVKGNLSPSWKGGRIKIKPGYVMVSAPNTKRGYIYEHRFVATKMLGRPLTKIEVVHHKNGNREDNRPENLEIFPSHKEHKELEATISLFARQIMFGDIAPHIKEEIQSLFTQFLRNR